MLRNRRIREPYVRWCERSENESRKKTTSFSSYSISVFEIPSGTIISSAMLCSIKNRTTVTDNAILYYKLLFYYFACS